MRTDHVIIIGDLVEVPIDENTSLIVTSDNMHLSVVDTGECYEIPWPKLVLALQTSVIALRRRAKVRTLLKSPRRDPDWLA